MIGTPQLTVSCAKRDENGICTTYVPNTSKTVGDDLRAEAENCASWSLRPSDDTYYCNANEMYRGGSFTTKDATTTYAMARAGATYTLQCDQGLSTRDAAYGQDITCVQSTNTQCFKDKDPKCADGAQLYMCTAGGGFDKQCAAAPSIAAACRSDSGYADGCYTTSDCDGQC